VQESVATRSAGVLGSPSRRSESHGRRFRSEAMASMDFPEETSTWWPDVKKGVWQFTEDMHSSPWARAYTFTATLAILVCVALSMMDVLAPGKLLPSSFVLVLEMPFVVELVVRFIACPVRHLFWFDSYNIIDLAAILASALPRLVGVLEVVDEETAYSCKIFSPFFILLRLLRRFEHFQLLTSAFSAAARALPVLLYTLLLIALLHAGIIYLVEPREVIDTLIDSVWFTMVTMSTVGYGDISPVTIPGRAVSVLLMLISGLYTAIPIGIVGNAFSSVWEDRERLLLLQQLRNRISRAGYTPQDLVKFFHRLDRDGNHKLTFDEFKDFLPMMHIKMSDEIAFRVFETFDDDGEGSIDFIEFLLGIFPAQSYYMSTVGRRRAAMLAP